MNSKEIVNGYLKTEPKFRERSNKDRGIVNLLMRRYSGLREAVDTSILSKEAIIAIMQDYATMDRAWRQALEQDESLRGVDYAEKTRLEQEHELALGYTPGFDIGIP